MRDLLVDYDLIQRRPMTPPINCAAFLHRHLQHLIEHPRGLFSLVHFEGPPQSAQAAQDLVQRKLWPKPWIRSTPAWLPPLPQAKHAAATIDITTQFRFANSCAGGLAIDADLAFFVKRLGQIGIIHLQRQEELPHVLSVRAQRPLGMFASDDARFLAVAFDNGQADILRLIIPTGGVPTGHDIVATAKYLIPDMDPPVMMWIGSVLLFQPDAKRLRGGRQASPPPLNILTCQTRRLER